MTSQPLTRDHTPNTPTKGGADARAEAVRLRAEGVTVSEIARRLKVARETVSRWLNATGPAVEALEVERARRAQTFEDAVTASRNVLRDGLEDAARKLVTLTSHEDPAVALRATTALMDRAGLPRVEVVQSAAAPMDLSGLTPEELDVFEALLSKVGGGS